MMRARLCLKGVILVRETSQKALALLYWQVYPVSESSGLPQRSQRAVTMGHTEVRRYR